MGGLQRLLAQKQCPQLPAGQVPVLERFLASVSVVLVQLAMTRFAWLRVIVFRSLVAVPVRLIVCLLCLFARAPRQSV